MDQTDSNTGATDRESVHARLLNASRDQVMHAFRAPEHFAQWWGSKDFRNIIHSFDFRPGDVWSAEIAERQRIVFSHPDSAHSVHLGAAG